MASDLIAVVSTSFKFDFLMSGPRLIGRFIISLPSPTVTSDEYSSSPPSGKLGLIATVVSIDYFSLHIFLIFRYISLIMKYRNLMKLTAKLNKTTDSRAIPQFSKRSASSL